MLKKHVKNEDALCDLLVKVDKQLKQCAEDSKESRIKL